MSTILKRYHFVIADEFSVVLDVDHSRADAVLQRCFEHMPFDLAVKMLSQFDRANTVVLARFAQKLVRFGTFNTSYCIDPTVPAPWDYEKHGIYVVRYDALDISALDIALVHVGDAPLPAEDICRPFVPSFLQGSQA